MKYRMLVFGFATLMAAQLAPAQSSSGTRTSGPTLQTFQVPADGQLPLVDFPAVPKDYISWSLKSTLKDARKGIKDSYQNCGRVPGRELPAQNVEWACSEVMHAVDADLRDEPLELGLHHYSDIAFQIFLASAARACYLHEMQACFMLGEKFEMWENIPAARMAWKVCDQDYPADPCRQHLKDTEKLSASQLAARDQTAFAEAQNRVEQYKEEKAAKKSDHSTGLAILAGIDAGLADTNRRLSETNAEQAESNRQMQAQAQVQVAANNERRAEESAAAQPQTHQSSFHIGQMGNNGGGTHLSGDSGTAAPPVGAPLPSPASTTAVLTVCPASGFVPGVMKQSGDTAVGVPCTPGQPIGSAPSPVPPTSTAGLTLAQPMDRCVSQFNANDNLSFTNNCTAPVYVEWYVGSHSGSWTLGPGETTHSGYSGADVTAGGSRYYACPQNYSPVDASYNRINTAVSNYICRLF